MPLVPALGIVWNFAMMYSLGWDNWIRLGVWFVVGQVLYFAYGYKHSNLRGRARASSPAARMLPFRIVYHEGYDLNLGQHVFPSQKFRWIRERLLQDRIAAPEDFVAPAPASRRRYPARCTTPAG